MEKSDSNYPISYPMGTVNARQVFYDIKSWVYHNGTSVGVPETFNFTYFVLAKNLTEPNNVRMPCGIVWWMG